MIMGGNAKKIIEQKELEQMLESYFKDLVIDLNLRLLVDIDGEACMNEPLLWVEGITLTEVGYPAVQEPAAAGEKSFRQRLAGRLSALWKHIKFW